MLKSHFLPPRERPPLVPIDEFLPPDHCPRRVTREHHFRQKLVGPDESQPFAIQAHVCDFCSHINPLRPLPPEAADFIRAHNAKIS